MPIFDYKAVTPAGKGARGMVEAENPRAARLKLKKQGLIVTEVVEKTAAKPSSSGGGMPFFGGRVGVKEISLMTRQLASLVKANIPLVEALNALVDQTEIEALKVVLSHVRDDVNEGLSLAKSVAKYPKVFDNIYVNMIEAGESSGTLGLVLIRLAELKESQTRLRGKLISGMTYPALMVVVSSLLMVGIFTFVIPKITEIFQSMNKPIPPITQFLILISGTLTGYWYLFGGAFLLTVMGFRNYIRTKGGRKRWDAFKLRAPVFGPIVRMSAVTRFASTMGTLLGSGVPILSAMSIARNIVDNVPIAEAIQSARENITEGQSIADPLRKSSQFPPMVIHMIAIGEKTGELPEMLRNIASNYEEQVSVKIDGLTSLLEPIMMVVMGGVVAFIVLSIFVPLMDMSNIQGR